MRTYTAEERELWRRNAETHVLYTGDEPDSPSAVTEWGAAVCRLCGDAEGELDRRVCPRGRTGAP